jgi:diketogulonate reductase-like aldo/keto reductase
MFFVMQPALVAAVAAVPTVEIAPGVHMPMISLGTWQYNSSLAESVVSLGLKLGFTHIDTANDYKNQDGVGRALASHFRDSYFLTTKVPPQALASKAYAGTAKDLDANMQLLGLAQVDLVLLHFPPMTQSCAAMQEAWRAMEDFLAAKRTRAIGVSNYCPATIDCLLAKARVVPAVNQVMWHVGMGADPIGLRSYCALKNITLQAYSPLGDGSSELITGDLVSGIGSGHNKSGAQVSLRWVAQHGAPVSTKATDPKYLAQDLDIFSWSLSDAELARLDAATTPAGKPSFVCRKESVVVVEQA